MHAAANWRLRCFFNLQLITARNVDAFWHSPLLFDITRFP